MTSFEDRKKQFENKFAHDEEMRFKASMRRNKLVGLWAAGEMGLSGEDAEAYAKDVIKADFEEVGQADVVRKLLQDFRAKGVDISEHRIERKMQDCMDEARRQIMEEKG